MVFSLTFFLWWSRAKNFSGNWSQIFLSLVELSVRTPCLPSLDCVLGPINDEELDKDKPQQRTTFSHPPPTHPFPHNAFHVWDQDDVVIPLPHDENPQISPLLMAAIPYIPSFFPHSPTSHNSMNFSVSPSASRGFNIPREVWFWYGGSATANGLDDQRPQHTEDACRCDFEATDVAAVVRRVETPSHVSLLYQQIVVSSCLVHWRRFLRIMQPDVNTVGLSHIAPEEWNTTREGNPRTIRDYWRRSLDVFSMCLSSREELMC